MKHIVEYFSQSEKLSLINEYLLGKNKNLKSDGLFDFNMSYSEVIEFFIAKGYKIYENYEYFFDDQVRENELYTLEENALKHLRFRTRLHIYMLNFSGKFMTDIFVIEGKTGNHYRAPSNVRKIDIVIDQINNELK